MIALAGKGSDVEKCRETICDVEEVADELAGLYQYNKGCSHLKRVELVHRLYSAAFCGRLDSRADPAELPTIASGPEHLRAVFAYAAEHLTEDLYLKLN